MKYFIFFLLLIGQQLQAQVLSTSDQKIIGRVKQHIEYLASDKLEGRRTGTAGEQLAYQYISSAFKEIGLTPKGEDGGYIQPFPVDDGKSLSGDSYVEFNRQKLVPEKDYFAFASNPDNNLQTEGSLNATPQKGKAFFWDLKSVLEEKKNNPHLVLNDRIQSETKDLVAAGVSALFIFNSSSVDDELKFDPKSKAAHSAIPVIYLSKEIIGKFLPSAQSSVNIRIKIQLEEKKRTGHNIVGYIDNHASSTIVLGAHYDHLGYGEDHNSLYTGLIPQIHNGADDNASGSAALIELARWIKASGPKNKNFAFVSFSGEELGLFGSKYFSDHPFFDLSTTECMINMDMVGRLNDSTHGLSIGGYGTSPAWGELIPQKDDFFSIKFDSSGSGPSDHTSFYRKDIPVLFFFTGLHSDYHKPSDDADKINYKGEFAVMQYVFHLVEKIAAKDKLAFTKTRESATASKSGFKVTLGIMPDYTFSGSGVRADGISEGKSAQKAGLKAGDIIVQLGDTPVSEMQSYMEALGKFKKGDKTVVQVKRGTELLKLDVEF